MVMFLISVPVKKWCHLTDTMELQITYGNFERLRLDTNYKWTRNIYGKKLTSVLTTRLQATIRIPMYVFKGPVIIYVEGGGKEGGFKAVLNWLEGD